MSTYAIGDVQGCFDELQTLLRALDFEPARDRLVFCGDLVNRGPKSLETLRYARSLGQSAMSVLGNHDLHLLALDQGDKPGRRDTLDTLLAAPDRAELMDWLRAQPLAWRHESSGSLVIHAGLAPSWSATQALELADEAMQAIRGARGGAFLKRMYGDQPDRWDDGLRGTARLRGIVNCFTRLRYCTADGRFDFGPKGAPGTQPPHLLPWFRVPGRRSADTPLVFGHWSTLGRVHWPEERVHGLDTGCIWGGKLTALDLDTGALHAVPGTRYSAID